METGKIVNGSYVQGDLSFAVDADNAHKTFDAVAALSNADKSKLAKLNGIPCEPFNKSAITGILKSVVQNVWFAHKTGKTPPEVLAGHTTRLAAYTAQLAVSTSTVDLLSRKQRSESTRVKLLYTLDKDAYEKVWQDWRGQRALTVGAFLTLKGTAGDKGVSLSDLHDAIPTEGTRETKKPTKNAMGLIVNALKDAGIVTCLNPQDAQEKKPRAKKGEATTPPGTPQAGGAKKGKK